MKREVFKGDKPFAASFYPVTCSITMDDWEETNSFTVWNDRPQAGSVHYDGSIKLLIDRRIRSNDSGGISEPMFLEQKGNLMLNFQVKAYPKNEINPEMLVPTQRDPIAFITENYHL